MNTQCSSEVNHVIACAWYALADLQRGGRTSPTRKDNTGVQPESDHGHRSNARSDKGSRNSRHSPSSNTHNIHIL